MAFVHLAIRCLDVKYIEIARLKVKMTVSFLKFDRRTGNTASEMHMKTWTKLWKLTDFSMTPYNCNSAANIAWEYELYKHHHYQNIFMYLIYSHELI